jgi:hypothetical protein
MKTGLISTDRHGGSRILKKSLSSVVMRDAHFSLLNELFLHNG